MIRFTPFVRRSRLSLALGTSILAWVSAPSTARAQCAPDPTQANGTTNCSGTDSDGLTVSTSGTTVVVQSGATVRSGNAAAAISYRTSADNLALYDTLTIAGTIDGMSKPAISLFAGPVTTVTCNSIGYTYNQFCSPGSPVTVYPSAFATINVAAGATVTGSQALVTSRDPSNSGGNIGGYVSASITNAGTITGTAGPAIAVTVPGNLSAGATRVTNESTGFIGGMTGSLSTIANAGTIDGGADAAIATTVSGASVTNTGRIVSSGGAATLSGTGALTVTNASGATLGGAATAINVGGALTLTNTGTINGGVISTAAAGQNSIVDTRGGMVNGDLRLGAGDDTLRAALDATTGRILSISGITDGGAGLDTLALDPIGSNTTIRGAALPTGFELLGLTLTNNATVTLATGIPSGIGVALSGYGTAVNEADLATNGPAVTASTGYLLAFTNNGSITSTLSAGQVAVSTLPTLTNAGTITATGGSGVGVSSLLTNTGTITATATAASVQYGTFTSSGTVRSSGGIGLQLAGNSPYLPSGNTGTIAGGTIGASISDAVFNNSGTISGGTSGVSLGYFGKLVNLSGGVITGGTNGVTNTNSGISILNAGTINGGVSLTATSLSPYDENVFADAGGTVNGAIRLGSGDDLVVVDFATDPNRPLAGATGGIDGSAGGYDILRYRVNADAATAVTLPNGFEGLSYELDNGAALTLNAATPIATSIDLLGNGTVTLSGAISGANRTLINTGATSTAALTTAGTGPQQSLTIINNGALSFSGSQPAPGTSGPFAIFAPASDLTNNGSITLTGYAIGIGNAATVVNTGSVTDTPGSNAIGVSTTGSLDNSGTIEVGGVAVQSDSFGGTITNSGRIASTRSAAIRLSYGTIDIANLAGGTIAGGNGQAAIQVAGGTLDNAGTITGSVDLGYLQFGGGSYYGGVYIANGGTLTGDLRFGEGSDFFIAMNDAAGVSGTIDGKGGTDTYIHALTADGTVALGALTARNFEQEGVRAIGADTVVTVTSAAPFASDLLVSGDGQIVNEATINGAVNSGPYLATPAFPYGSMASFTNAGTISGGFAAQTQRFVNSGSVGTSNLTNSAVNLNGTAVDFRKQRQHRQQRHHSISYSDRQHFVGHDDDRQQRQHQRRRTERLRLHALPSSPGRKRRAGHQNGEHGYRHEHVRKPGGRIAAHRDHLEPERVHQPRQWRHDRDDRYVRDSRVP